MTPDFLVMSSSALHCETGGLLLKRWCRLNVNQESTVHLVIRDLLS
jgi:hypothetical protein